MKVVEDVSAIYDFVYARRMKGDKIGLVPTMGALHAGHLSLACRAVAECDVTVATIFVNPTQFGPNEDFARYPRTLENDISMLDTADVDIVFAPNTGDMYSPSHSTWVDSVAVTASLEGEYRPGHYRGVATIVMKLFQLIPAHVAYFGQKDFQQLLVIQRMVADLNVPIRIQGCPTIRESDGLAMSSRNRYLSAEDRSRAVGLSRALLAARSVFFDGQRSPTQLEETMKVVLREFGVDRIDYARVVDSASLQTATEASLDSVALIAARLGTTRLIDNTLFRSNEL